MDSIVHRGPARGRRRLRLVLLGMVSATALTLAITGLPGVRLVPPSALAQGAAAQTESRYERSYADLIERVMPAVVNVAVERAARAGDQVRGPGLDPEMRRFFERFFGQPAPTPQRPPPQVQRGEGSGFVIDAAGHIVTNAHVAGGADKITVTLQDGSQHEAKLVGIDEKTDLAVVKVDAGRPLAFVPWADSSSVRVGDKVIAVGNPFGLGGTVTSGIVSATGREIGAGPYDDFLQLDAAINRGNSGGPTFDLDGRVIGVNSMIFSPSGGSVGIGFAISANLAKEVVDELIAKGRVDRGWLGVGIQELTPDLAEGLGAPDLKGALVTSVEPGSPAERAGIKTGDVIRTFDGQPIERLRQLTRAVAAVEPGRPAEVVVVAQGRERTIQVEVGAQPTVQAALTAPDGDAEKGMLGLALADLTPEARRELGLADAAAGVLVREVQPGSPAAEKGVRAGDLILRVGDTQVRRADEVRTLLAEAHAKGSRSVLLLVQREGRQLFTAIPFAVS